MEPIKVQKRFVRKARLKRFKKLFYSWVLTARWSHWRRMDYSTVVLSFDMDKLVKIRRLAWELGVGPF